MYKYFTYVYVLFIHKKQGEVEYSTLNMILNISNLTAGILDSQILLLNALQYYDTSLNLEMYTAVCKV